MVQRNIVLTDLVSEKKNNWKVTGLLEKLPMNGNGALATALKNVLDKQLLAGLETERYEATKRIKHTKERLSELEEMRDDLTLRFAAIKGAVYSLGISGKASQTHAIGGATSVMGKETGLYDNLNYGKIFNQEPGRGIEENDFSIITFGTESSKESMKFAATKSTLETIDGLQKEGYENSLEMLTLGREMRLLQEQVQMINLVELNLRAALGETRVVEPRRLVFEYDPGQFRKGIINPGCVQGIVWDKHGGAINTWELLAVESFGADKHLRSYGVHFPISNVPFTVPNGGIEAEVYERAAGQMGNVRHRWLQHKEGSARIQAFNRGPMQQDKVLEKYLDGQTPECPENTLVPLFERLN
ncbi:MAG: hypothetical protein NTX79_02235 [Candidatus Micrarchaeota archaeon]|nr:hypothetical protein [Candidatus Micrarchaeota archaeon]